ncbi:hypothetical protein VCV18_008747 [Metarhizium anisopliae]
MWEALKLGHPGTHASKSHLNDGGVPRDGIVRSTDAVWFAVQVVQVVQDVQAMCMVVTVTG